MGKTGISDKKLNDIATEIGDGKHVMKLALKLGLSAAEANNTGLDCYKVLLKARNATGRKDQKDKLRDGLIKSGYKAIADKHLPLRNPGKKAELKTESTPSQQRKRKIEETTLDKPPTTKKPKGGPKLEEEENKLKKIRKELKDLQKKKTEVEKQIDQKLKEETKISSVVKKLKEQQYEKNVKLLAKEKEELDKFNSSDTTTNHPPSGSNS
eukprot:XP_011662876.1 PREDICTED: uncharacterized protein LOC105437689 [Strongylocentrotus purpuratus]